MSSEVQRYITGIMTPVEMANPGPASISARQTVVVTYDDYAALEAERERLADELARKSVITGDCIARCQRLADERDALAAELAAIKGRGEEVEVVAWQDAENPLYTTAERRMMHEWANNQYQIVELMTVAQHQRITAAMAAELERLKLLERVLDDVRAERDELVEASCALRAELAATSEAQDHTSEAAPGVVGLVKALEEVLSVIDAREMPSELDLAALSNMIDTAISTWRQSHP